jgi:hypothetical protein
MVRFSHSRTKSETASTNKEGGPNYKLTPKEQLVQIATTLLFKEPKFYGDVQETMDNAIDAVAKDEPEFILKLASYCRNEMYLRTVSIYLLVKAANTKTCKEFVRKYTPRIIKRADEIYEALACHIKLFCPEPETHSKGPRHKDKKIPNSLKKGIQDVFPAFDEYQFAKYNRKTDVSFKDAIMLTHPSNPSEIIKKILDDSLKTPYTWETELSDKGNTAEVWHKLIDSGKLPYMAMIRNINNLEKSKVDKDHFEKVCAKIEEPEAVKHSKQFPFRFFSVYKNVDIDNGFKKKKLLKALEKALSLSVDNLPKLKGDTLIATDTSGSMGRFLSTRGKIEHIEIGALMAAMANKFSENGVASVFGTDFSTVDLSGNILSDTKKLCETNVGWSTNGYKVVKYLNDKDIKVDRVLLFTDEELYDSSDRWGDDNGRTLKDEFSQYKKRHPKAKLYVVNLNGYGDSCINYKDPNVVTVSGWSDKILQFISAYEEGKQSFIQRIDSQSYKKRA